MFTGIIESLGIVRDLKQEGENLRVTIDTPFADELQIDQSIAHNGVCLTVVHVDDSGYSVVAVQETLEKSNLGMLKVGMEVNLERAMILGSRLDGHLVQGHIDITASCTGIKESGGSWVFSFAYKPQPGYITVEKGSITIDGVSLTVFNAKENSFQVAIIPYTYQNTLFKNYQAGTVVNLEFDIIGKYVSRLLSARA